MNHHIIQKKQIFLRCDKKDDDETNSKSNGFLKLMPISQLDPNKLNSNKEVLQRFFKIQSKYPSCVSKKKVAEELLPEILVNCGKIPCPTKLKLLALRIYWSSKKTLNVHIVTKHEFRMILSIMFCFGIPQKRL